MSQSAALRRALEPKSDQLNADDLIGGGITIKIRRVTVQEKGEQRIAIFYEGDNEKPYKPGKAMGRVIMDLWGDDPQVYIGRSITLYRDPDIHFGPDKVGGIRISHMSNIDGPTEASVTLKRSKRTSVTIKPIKVDAGAPAAPKIDVEALRNEGGIHARKGADSLRTWWQGIGGAKQKAIGGEPYLDELKAIAGIKPAPQSDDPPDDDNIM